MSVPTVPAGQAPSPEEALDVDAGGFLPEGVALAEPSEAEVSGGDGDHPLAPYDGGSLQRLEADLDDVDDALVAIDEGRYQGGPWDRIGSPKLLDRT